VLAKPHTGRDRRGRPSEVDAAKTSKLRGVRIVASAHGDLRSLVKNNDLRGLIGGVGMHTIGDVLAVKQNGKKQVVERLAEPIFDVIIEVNKKDLQCWTIIFNVANAVDLIQYQVQKR